MRKMACEFNVRAGLTKKCHSESREEMGRGGATDTRDLSSCPPMVMYYSLLKMKIPCRQLRL